MSDRKYRQRGYDDDPRERGPKPETPRKPQEPGAPAGARRISQDGPKNMNMPGFRQVTKCTHCGAAFSGDVGLDSRCGKCGADLHACAQCSSFDPGSRFECMQTIPARVSPKNDRNTCNLFTSRTTYERETTTPRAADTNDAKKAFDDLFNL